MEHAEFTSKEHIIYFMVTSAINLSHYDFKFISNMQSLSHDKKQITSNQEELFNKLIDKYKKQLKQHNYNSELLLKLPWKCLVVPSLPKYTNANVDYDSTKNQLTIRVPFKKEFINAFGSNTEKGNSWKWNGDIKRYETEPNTKALRIAYEMLPRFFPTIYHNEVKDIITQLEKKVCQFDTPTLTIIDGKYTVVESNKILDEKLKDIPLNETASCLYQLSLLGVSVDNFIVKDNPELLFASSYVAECDLDDLNTVVAWMFNLGCTELYMGRGISHKPNAFNRSLEKLTSGNEPSITSEIITIVSKYDMQMFSPRSQKNNSTLPMLLQFSSVVDPEKYHGDASVGKIIILKNKRPVEVK